MKITRTKNKTGEEVLLVEIPFYQKGEYTYRVLTKKENTVPIICMA